MITCQTVTTMHTDAREGVLAGWAAFRYGFHMKICARCQAYQQGIEHTIEALADLPPEPAPERSKQRALEAMRALRR